MTALLASLLCLAPSLSNAPVGPEGVYKAPNSVPEHWQINANHTLVWDGQPYMPVGVRIPGTVGAIKSAAAAGIENAIVELPADGLGWTDAFDALEKSGMRYLIAVDSVGPMARGVSVEPAGYRIEGITESQHVELTLPGAQSVLAILATRRDGEIEMRTRVSTPKGHFSLDLKPLNDLDHVLLLYPEQVSLQQPDFWDEFDSHRDTLIASLRLHPPGKGLRALVNPMGSVVRLPSQGARFVPTNSYFRMELAAYLESKYRNLDTALKTWSLSSSDVDSFERLATLVPLWSGSRGVSQLWDPTTDKLYPCDSKFSQAWRDIEDVISTTSDRRFRRLVASIRNVADVPVVQDWAGWAAPYETADPALDGVGVRTDTDSPAALADQSGRGVSSVLRWRRSGWTLATRVDLARSKDQVAALPGVLDDLASIGTRGWFVKADDPQMEKAVAAEALKRSGDTSLAEDGPKPIYYPESALNPACAQRLPGGHWWLPSPASGNRVDLGSHFFAYRILEPRGSTLALWSDAEPHRVNLRVMDPKPMKFTTLDGSDPMPKINKTGVEVWISQTPLLITGTEEIPVPEGALLETMARFDQLTKLAESSGRDISDDKYFFRDNLNGFDRNPGGSLSVLRGVVLRLTQKLAPYVWVEGESVVQSNFGESDFIPGCSSGAVLNLSTALSGRKYFAEYEVSVRSAGEQEVWLAARIPESLRKRIRILIGGQALSLSGEGISPYGLGFAWYRFGTTKLAGTKAKLRIEVDSVEGADLAIDTLMLSPGEFRPNGINMPDTIKPVFAPATP